MIPGYDTDDVSRVHLECMHELAELAKPVTTMNCMVTVGETVDNWKDSNRGREGQQPKLQLPWGGTQKQATENYWSLLPGVKNPPQHLTSMSQLWSWRGCQSSQI